MGKFCVYWIVALTSCNESKFQAYLYACFQMFVNEKGKHF